MVTMTRRGFSFRILSGVAATTLAATVGRSDPAGAHDGPHSEDVDDTTAHVVEIGDFAFQPATLRVRVGDTVTWVNRDIAPHTATAGDSSWDTGAIRTDEQVSVPITPDMPTDYYCRFHPMMTARLEIVPDG